MNHRFKPSVTVAAIVQRRSGTRCEYLLVEELTSEGLQLNNPAGHLEPGESPQQGVVRETLEETAREFVPEALLGVYLSRFLRPATGEDVTYVRFAYVGRVGDAEPGRALDTGIVRTVWMTADEIRASRDRHRSPLVLECLEDHLAGRRFPLDAVVTHPTVAAPEVKVPGVGHLDRTGAER